MRIAAIVDIHGNLAALEAVLTDIDTTGVDRLVCCGDIALGAPDDRGCYHRILETGAPIVRGNADRYVTEFGTPAADPRWTTQQFGPLQFSVSQFSAPERAALGALPTSYRLPEAPDILFYHANPANDVDVLRQWTPEHEFEANYAGHDAAVYVGGHTHTQYVRSWRGRQIVVCGSVGATNDSSAGAQYALIEGSSGSWTVTHRDVDYDVKETLRRFEDCDYLGRTGPIGRLMVRGVATRSPLVSQFLDWYRDGHQDQGLDAAVESFLTLY